MIVSPETQFDCIGFCAAKPFGQLRLCILMFSTYPVRRCWGPYRLYRNSAACNLWRQHGLAETANAAILIWLFASENEKLRKLIPALCLPMCVPMNGKCWCQYNEEYRPCFFPSCALKYLGDWVGVSHRSTSRIWWNLFIGHFLLWLSAQMSPLASAALKGL